MFNPIEYFFENLSWYAPIYNISWVIMMVGTFAIPLIVLAMFKLPILRDIQPTASWKTHRQTIWYLLLGAFVIFCFRLIPYWIFNDKWLHFMGGGISIALVYQYYTINFKLDQTTGAITLAHLKDKKLAFIVANVILLTFFSAFYSLITETYEFVSKVGAGVEFDSDGIDTWIDILMNLAGSYFGYLLIQIYFAIKGLFVKSK